MKKYLIVVGIISAITIIFCTFLSLSIWNYSYFHIFHKEPIYRIMPTKLKNPTNILDHTMIKISLDKFSFNIPGTNIYYIEKERAKIYSNHNNTCTLMVFDSSNVTNIKAKLLGLSKETHHKNLFFAEQCYSAYTQIIYTTVTDLPLWNIDKNYRVSVMLHAKSILCGNDISNIYIYEKKNIDVYQYGNTSKNKHVWLVFFDKNNYNYNDILLLSKKCDREILQNTIDCIIASLLCNDS